MSKTTVAIGILGATATVAVAAPTALLLGGGNNGEGENVSRGNYKEPSWEGKMPELANSTSIKSEYTKIDCLKDYLGSEINWEHGNSQTNIEPDLDFTNSSKGDVKGCLMVDYYKQPFSNFKWWGGFRFIWTLANDKEGLIIVFNSSAKDGSFKFDSSVYIVEKSDNKWSQKYKYEKTEKEVIADEQMLLQKFPQTSEAMFSKKGQDYWGFSPVPNNVCKVGECKENSSLDPNKTEKPMKWEWQKDDNKGKVINEWFSNFDKWFKNLFPEGKESNVKSQLKKLKGKWIRKDQEQSNE